MARGIYSIIVEEIQDVKDFQEKAINIVKDFDFICAKDIVVLTSGTNSAIGMTNLMKIEEIHK